MDFKYTAGRSDGTLVDGLLQADSEINAQQMLWDSGLTIIDLKKKLKLPALHEALPSVFGIKRRDVINFSTNLASLLEAGIPVMRALNIQSRLGKRAMQDVIKDVLTHLEKGDRLSDACSRYPSIFSNFYIFMLRTGEEVGNLSEVLKQTAAHMQRDEETAGKIKRSLAYPAFVLALAVAAIFVMMSFVVPALTSMFAEFRAELPMMTRGLIAVSDFFQANALYMVIAVVGIAVVTVLYLRTDGGQRTKDRVVLRIPMVGQAVHKGSLSRFCRNMSMLVGAGVPLFDALRLTSETSDNTVVAKAVRDVHTRVGDGDLFSEAVEADDFYPILLPEMIKVGEESGSLTEQLTRIANYYEEEAERAINMVTSMLTPALTIGVGGIIGLIAVTIFSSIYSMVDVLPE